MMKNFTCFGCQYMGHTQDNLYLINYYEVMDSFKGNIEEACQPSIYTDTGRKMWSHTSDNSPFLVTYDFDRDRLPGLVVVCPHHLAEGAFPNNLQDFVPIAKMVVQDLGKSTNRHDFKCKTCKHRCR